MFIQGVHFFLLIISVVEGTVMESLKKSASFFLCNCKYFKLLIKLLPLFSLCSNFSSEEPEKRKKTKYRKIVDESPEKSIESEQAAVIDENSEDSDDIYFEDIGGPSQ
jgi:hypothetical protein